MSGGGTSSTLVERVSIDYEDFNESFLTCGTCLCTYDGSDHSPKLLPCSHTLCLQCLERIIAAFARDSGQFRCPICRELVGIPRGGVSALPPSFLVNQLLDLMAKQRREVVPKCSLHSNRELLFCESCDVVFCNHCNSGSGASHGSSSTPPSPLEGGTPKHQNSSLKFSSNDHTVIPFSIAIKRMSEILIYKASECTSKLNAACEAVNSEMQALDRNADTAHNVVNKEFQLISEALEAERLEALESVKRTRDEKKKILEEQLAIIQSEKNKVDTDIQTSQQQVEVRSITKKISDLNCKLDAISALCEPRENAFIEYSLNESDMSKGLSSLLKSVGCIKTSRTFPSLCRVTMSSAICHLETVAKLQTIDYNGSVQFRGGDPVDVGVWDNTGDTIPVSLKDLGDGTYDIRFTLHTPGTYCLKVLIFNRPIKDCPLFFDVSEHNSPMISFGSRGTKEKGFMQPCNVAVDPRNGNVFVIDTGNSRIKVLSENLNFIRHISNEGLDGRSVTGICLNERNSYKSLFVINWRTKTITELSVENDGETLNSFTHEDFKEPIDLAYWKSPSQNSDEDKIVVADNGMGAILVINAKSGELHFQIKPPPQNTSNKAKKSYLKNQTPCDGFKDLTAVCVSPSGDIVIAANSEIQIFDCFGKFIRLIETSDKGRFGGLCCDSEGYILATRSEKSKSFIQIFDFEDGAQYSFIDSHGSKMKRPTGLAVFPNKHVIVVDIGNDCVKKYRYL